MAHGSRPTAFPTAMSTGSSLRQPNAYSVASQQASVLAARIESKKAELENLRQLRDLSKALADRMQALEEKIGTLKEGTEAVACVLANWDNVLQAINMATTKVARLQVPESEVAADTREVAPLPATLVRIPAVQPEKPMSA
ncbi:hypothetical protein VTN77DRAFT_3010 [Rasamsonia byssochlamydoides]|uniref:uncharacterized protein n=1 Tax=Rasamsonia byssochlamydoides TaxID=89139 RepID=UPI00374417D1